MRNAVHLPYRRRKSFLEIIRPYLFLIPIYALMVTFKYIPFFHATAVSHWDASEV